jgi:hypothetical protein
MRTYFKLLLCITFSGIVTGLAAESMSDSLSMKIELANPRVYKVDDEILIDIKIFNMNDKELSTLMAADKRYSFDFTMVTMQNRKIEHSRDYIVSFHRVKPVFNSQLRLSPHEGYTYQVRLNDYFDIDTSGQFFVSGHFYPDLKLNNHGSGAVESNVLSLNIRPAGIEENYIKERREVEEEKHYMVTRRPPDEVVAFTLDARMKHAWEKFFLYLDLEKLILTNSNFRDKYVTGDTGEQVELIDQYKQKLKMDTIDQISFLPHRYEIIKTEYMQGEGKVDVLISFKYLDYVEEKYYTYFLHKKGNIWYIHNYEVMNLGVR